MFMLIFRSFKKLWKRIKIYFHLTKSKAWEKLKSWRFLKRLIEKKYIFVESYGLYIGNTIIVIIFIDKNASSKPVLIVKFVESKSSFPSGYRFLYINKRWGFRSQGIPCLWKLICSYRLQRNAVNFEGMKD